MVTKLMDFHRSAFTYFLLAATHSIEDKVRSLFPRDEIPTDANTSAFANPLFGFTRNGVKDYAFALPGGVNVVFRINSQSTPIHGASFQWPGAIAQFLCF